MKRSPLLDEPKAIVIAAVITGVFGMLAALAFAFLPDNTIANMPEAVSTVTPKPTVVGTPIIGADLAVTGNVGDTVVAYDISLVVDSVRVYTQTIGGLPETVGYVYIVVEVRAGNGSSYYISPLNLKLIDNYSNQYANWGTSMAEQFNFPSFPVLTVGESGGGAAVFRVPDSAVENSLKLILELEHGAYSEPSVLIQIPFGNHIPIETLLIVD